MAVAVERHVEIPLKDGSVLAGSLYRPDDDRPHPGLLSYYPYRKDDIIGSLFDQTRRRFAKRGYADLLVDMAGTGSSEGRYGETFNLEREGRDGAEIVEWMAEQGWCDGNIGVWGVSYGGFMAFASACQKPPHLKAIVSVYATTDNRKSLAPDACPPCFGLYSWAGHMLAMDLLPPTDQDSDGRWRSTWDERLRRMKRELPHGLEWQVHPAGDDYWSAGSVDPSDIEVPTLLIAGWRDVFTDAMLDIHAKVQGPHRIVVGPWLHVLPHLSEVEPWDWVGAMSEWWDVYLAPSDINPVRPGPSVLYFSQGTNVWHSEEQWPPEGTSETSYFLAGRGLVAERPQGSESQAYTGDATVGIAAGIWDPFGTGLGWPEEQSVDDVRSLTFTSAPIDLALEIAGKPSAEIFVYVENGVETQISVRLSRVGPDGRSSLITRGVSRVIGGGDPGLSSTRGTAGVLVTVPMAATSYTVGAGDRLRLSVATADFPHLWPTPAIPIVKLWCGADSPSSLHLPAVTNSGPTHDAPVQVARPPAGADFGWRETGQPTYTLQTDRTTGEIRVSLGLRSRLTSPLGAVVSNDEMFSASVRPQRPDAARLEGKSNFAVEMPAGERIVVTTQVLYRRDASICHASAEIDGVPIFEHHWHNWDGPTGRSAQ
jgi:uncharacterized protein